MTGGNPLRPTTYDKSASVSLVAGRPSPRLLGKSSVLQRTSENVIQLVIPISERARALEQLRLMNITRASLFPGLDGFAQSMRLLPIREAPQPKYKRLEQRIRERNIRR